MFPKNNAKARVIRSTGIGSLPFQDAEALAKQVIATADRDTDNFVFNSGCDTAGRNLGFERLLAKTLREISSSQVTYQCPWRATDCHP